MKRNKKTSADTEIINGETLMLEESLTIWNAVRIKESLIEAINKSESITLNFENSNEFDFSFLQLLFSAIKTAEMHGKKILIEKLKPEFEKLMESSGFKNINHPVFSKIDERGKNV
jgi:anti-anti-sigma regulatory factor